MAAPWRFGDASLASLVVLAAVAAASSSEESHMAVFTTFGVTNGKPNHTYVPPTPPPVLGAPAETRSSRLTTFGNPDTKPQNNTSKGTATVRGKDCKQDRDCAGLQNTTCQVDPRDQKKRCLCFDKSGPQNGACHHSRKGPTSACSADGECIRNAVCVSVNSTSPTSQKLCQCKGFYDEEDHECDSGGMLGVAPSCIIASVLIIASYVWL